MSLLKDLAIAAGRGAFEAIVRLVRGKQRESLPEVDVHVTEPPHPRFTDLEHQRAQERSSIAASKADEAKRSATTARPPRPKPGTLPK